MPTSLCTMYKLLSPTVKKKKKIEEGRQLDIECIHPQQVVPCVRDDFSGEKENIRLISGYSVRAQARHRRDTAIASNFIRRRSPEESRGGPLGLFRDREISKSMVPEYKHFHCLPFKKQVPLTRVCERNWLGIHVTEISPDRGESDERNGTERTDDDRVEYCRLLVRGPAEVAKRR